MLAEQLFWLMKNMSDGVFVCGKRKRRKGRGREEKKVLGDASQNSCNPYCCYNMTSDIQAMFLEKNFPMMPIY